MNFALQMRMAISCTVIGILPLCSGARAATGIDCARIASLDARALSVPKVRVLSAALQAGLPADAGAVPHCEVIGAIDERVGVDGLPYAIKFHLRMPVPDAWNGKLVFSGGGGPNGVLGDALHVTMLPYSPLSRGYAMVSTDSGHDNAVDTRNDASGARAFNFDPQARTDLAYSAYDRVTYVARELLERYEGARPQRAYYLGCSEGGREASMMTQRFPQLFDGVAAGAPAIDPGSSVSFNVDVVQSYAAVARKNHQFDRNGFPFLGKALSDADLAVLNAAILARCDRLDGVVDGMVQNLEQCQREFDPRALQCSANHPHECLSAPQVDALVKTMSGLHDRKGREIYPGLFWDQGTAGVVLRGVWLGSATSVQSSGAFIGALQLASYMTPPPRVNVDPAFRNGSEIYRTVLDWDPLGNYYRYFLTTEHYPESVFSQFYAASSNVAAFREHGGKLLIYQGGSDGILSVKSSIEWLDRIDRTSGGDAADFARLFIVPGMGHCGGGPATRTFDMLSALSDWVERGVKPDRIVATAPVETPWPGRSRPLCPYPRYSRYRGDGDVESEASFVCAAE